MGADALALALAAACLHALWNLLIARAADPEAATAVALVAAELVFAPVALATWHVEAAALPFIVVSGLLELAYIAMLAIAYVRVPLSIVYPVARGTAPVLVLLVSTAALGVRPSAAEVAGVLTVTAGVYLVRGIAGSLTPGSLGLPLAIACTIAAYTLVDRAGIRHAAAVPYFELTGLFTLAYPAWLVRRRGLAAVRAEAGGAAVLAGTAMFGAYSLVLLALRLAPPGPVAAVRESSVVIATGFAGVVLGERVSRLRLLGAALVAAGVAMLALS
jgi:drug/metabolite transporter (DMT)-like permease